MLEVRNDGWTEESINKYLKLLEHMVWKRYEMLNYDIEKFACHLFY